MDFEHSLSMKSYVGVPKRKVLNHGQCETEGISPAPPIYERRWIVMFRRSSAYRFPDHEISISLPKMMQSRRRMAFPDAVTSRPEVQPLTDTKLQGRRLSTAGVKFTAAPNDSSDAQEAMVSMYLYIEPFIWSKILHPKTASIWCFSLNIIRDGHAIMRQEAVGMEWNDVDEARQTSFTSVSYHDSAINCCPVRWIWRPN